MLSGGERTRVALAILSLRGANLLLLDEPTNHLDLDSQEVLQAALSSGDGTLLVVSHDRYLVRALCDEVWVIEGGALERYSTGYEEYRAAVASRREEAKHTTRSSRAEGGPVHRAGQKPRQRERQRLSARREAVEAEIEAKEAHLAGLTDALESATSARDVEQIAALGEEYAATEAAVADLLSEWEELAAAEARA
ncbi:MAG: ATP-binding cassette domain-containing protein [Anaerolineae bacterium]